MRYSLIIVQEQMGVSMGFEDTDMKRLVLLLLIITTSSFGKDIDLLCKDMSLSNSKGVSVDFNLENVLITLTIEDETNTSWAKVLGDELLVGDYLMTEVDKLKILAVKIGIKNGPNLSLNRYDGTLKITQLNDDKKNLAWTANGQCNPATSLF